jgi:hypothetical protein
MQKTDIWNANNKPNLFCELKEKEQKEKYGCA